MGNHGEHKRDKAAIVFWNVIGLGIGIVLGASTTSEGPNYDPNGWALGLTAGVVMGALMSWFATKPGLDQ